MTATSARGRVLRDPDGVVLAFGLEAVVAATPVLSDDEDVPGPAAEASALPPA